MADQQTLNTALQNKGAMEEGEIFTEIRAAESEAEHIISNAEKEKQRIIEEAGKTADSLISESIERSKAASEKKLSSFSENLLKEKQELIAKGKSEISAMAKKAEKNVPKAAMFLVERFRQRLKC